MDSKFGIAQALSSLRPGEPFVVYDNDYSTLEWKGEGKPPTKKQVEKEIARLEKEHAFNEYQRKRAMAYPRIGDQLDALFHAGLFPEEMAAKIQAVKDQYPKEK